MTTPNLISATSLTQGLLNTPAQLASGETNVYTSPSNKSIKVSTASLCNTTSLPVIVAVSVVPAAGTAGAANRVVTNYSLAAYDTLTQEDGLAALKGVVLADGQFISVNAGTATAVVFTITGTVIS
jgi:hypothetical protein